MIVTSRKSCGNQFSPDGKELVGGKRIKRTITVDRSFYDDLWVWLFQWDIKDPTCWGAISQIECRSIDHTMLLFVDQLPFHYRTHENPHRFGSRRLGDNSSCSAGTRFDKPIQLIKINIAFNRGQSNECCARCSNEYFCDTWQNRRRFWCHKFIVSRDSEKVSRTDFFDFGMRFWIR